ncbi:MAG: glycoside hydrolase family 127 protein [Spirochaetales bacterium]|nr:glycoside hydrolase family 127 protein [Spirochaetales bacterium]
MLPQVIFINDSGGNSKLRDIKTVSDRKKSVCYTQNAGMVTLDHGIFRERKDLIHNYLLKLKTELIFQNHLLEAGFRDDTPCDRLHRGWEEPHCQLRGHFAGHWLSAAALYCSVDDNSVLRARVDEAVDLIAECQKANGGSWTASIPEKYFHFLEQGRGVWSPQYTAHKTLMGLSDVYKFTGSQKAQEVLKNASRWYLQWCRKLEDEGSVIYQGECAGMLELWADLYGMTGEAEYLELTRFYGSPSLFDRLLKGEEALSHTHANASIPWIQGAARVYEATGDVYYREVVEAFWKSGVTERGMFATGGANAGEYWIPPQDFSNYFTSRTQEHCTVYNMIRVAEYLFTWTGDARYARYIEKSLYNGILAQQNGETGMVCYFLPMAPGSRKTWGRETEDFWCCHGSLVQAHSITESLIYHRRDNGISIDQYLPSRLDNGEGISMELSRLWDPDRMSETLSYKIIVESKSSETWDLFLRVPEWVERKPAVTVDGEALESFIPENGYIRISRSWSRNEITLTFHKQVRKEFLPGSDNLFALVDGPVVLAALCDREVKLDNKLRLTPCREHQYVGGQEWLEGHYLLDTDEGSIGVMPLYQVKDQVYSIYFREP